MANGSHLSNVQAWSENDINISISSYCHATDTKKKNICELLRRPTQIKVRVCSKYYKLSVRRKFYKSSFGPNLRERYSRVEKDLQTLVSAFENRLLLCVYYVCCMTMSVGTPLEEAFSGTKSDPPVNDAVEFYELASNLVDRGKRKIAFLDTGDHVIMSFETLVDPLKLRDAVIKLYDDLGISVVVTQTNIGVTLGQRDMIINTMGRVISESDSGVVTEIVSLEKQIEKVVAYFDVAKMYGKASEPKATLPSPWCVSSMMSDVPATPTPQKDCEGFTNNKMKYMAGISGADCLSSSRSADYWQPTDNKRLTKMHVLYNILYSMSLVFEDSVNRDCAEGVCQEYPEFELACTVTISDPESRKLCSQIFHKKTFKSRQDLDQKVVSFVQLFEVSTDECDMKGNKSELEQVQNILQTCFVVSADPSTTMKAIDLITGVAGRITKVSGTFKKRLPGLLLQCGLRKKRMKDGNYYYGIRLRDIRDFVPGDTRIDLDDFERRRRDEIHDLYEPSAVHIETARVTQLNSAR